MDNNMEKLKYSLIYSDNSIYIDKVDYLDKLFEKETVNLIGNCSDEELFGTDSNVPSWYLSLVARSSELVSILKIDLDDTSIVLQKRFLSIIKDRTFASYVLPKNCKILVVSSDKNRIDNELLECMTII